MCTWIDLFLSCFSVLFSLQDGELQDAFELSLYTSQASDMAALILDYINAIMENQPSDD